MLTTERIEQVLDRLPGLTVGVLGDLFLDRYLDIDDNLTEPSIETGLDAYQVVRVRFAADGGKLFTVGRDGAARRWQAEPRAKSPPAAPAPLAAPARRR